MNTTKIKKLFIGLLIGVLGLVVGVALFSLLYMQMTGVTMAYFRENFDMIFGHSPTQMITGMLIPDFLLFYWFMKKEKNMYAQGVMLVSIIMIIISIMY